MTANLENHFGPPATLLRSIQQLFHTANTATDPFTLFNHMRTKILGEPEDIDSVMAKVAKLTDPQIEYLCRQLYNEEPAVTLPDTLTRKDYHAYIFRYLEREYQEAMETLINQELSKRADEITIIFKTQDSTIKTYLDAAQSAETDNYIKIKDKEPTKLSSKGEEIKTTLAEDEAAFKDVEQLLTSYHELARIINEGIADTPPLQNKLVEMVNQKLGSDFLFECTYQDPEEKKVASPKVTDGHAKFADAYKNPNGNKPVITKLEKASKTTFETMDDILETFASNASVAIQIGKSYFKKLENKKMVEEALRMAHGFNHYASSIAHDYTEESKIHKGKEALYQYVTEEFKPTTAGSNEEKMEGPGTSTTSLSSNPGLSPENLKSYEEKYKEEKHKPATSAGKTDAEIGSETKDDARTPIIPFQHPFFKTALRLTTHPIFQQIRDMKDLDIQASASSETKPILSTPLFQIHQNPANKQVILVPTNTNPKEFENCKQAINACWDYVEAGIKAFNPPQLLANTTTEAKEDAKEEKQDTVPESIPSSDTIWQAPTETSDFLTDMIHAQGPMGANNIVEFCGLSAQLETSAKQRIEDLKAKLEHMRKTVCDTVKKARFYRAEQKPTEVSDASESPDAGAPQAEVKTTVQPLQETTIFTQYYYEEFKLDNDEETKALAEVKEGATEEAKSALGFVKYSRETGERFLSSEAMTMLFKSTEPLRIPVKELSNDSPTRETLIKSELNQNKKYPGIKSFVGDEGEMVLYITKRAGLEGISTLMNTVFAAEIEATKKFKTEIEAEIQNLHSALTIKDAANDCAGRLAEQLHETRTLSANGRQFFFASNSLT